MVNVTFYKDGTAEEISDLSFGSLGVVPRVGETIHWWEDKLDRTGLRKDFVVTHVRHDLRLIFTPGSDKISPCHSVEIYLR